MSMFEFQKIYTILFVKIFLAKNIRERINDINYYHCLS